VLILDDSVATGNEMARIRQKLTSYHGSDRHIFAAAFVAPQGRDLVDVFGEVVDLPRIFEWNLFHTAAVKDWCFDIDGVFCEDPPVGSEDDDVTYVQHLRNVRCLVAPRHRLGTLVSNRLERHRAPTEEWLAMSGIQYDRLVLRSEGTAEERRRVGRHAEFKADVYRHSKARLFIESDWTQAVFIANASSKAVYCTDAKGMVYPGQDGRLPSASRPGPLLEFRWTAKARLQYRKDRIKVTLRSRASG
jgi:orotate phosphoribosyltransferase